MRAEASAGAQWCETRLKGAQGCAVQGPVGWAKDFVLLVEGIQWGDWSRECKMNFPFQKAPLQSAVVVDLGQWSEQSIADSR